MDYSDYDNPQWDVDRVELEFKTGEDDIVIVISLCCHLEVVQRK